MRVSSFWLLAWAVTLSVCGQSYTIRTVAGGGLPENMPALSASLGNQLINVAIGPNGDVYLCLNHNAVVLRMDSSGFLTRVAGNSGQGFSGDGGLATSAQLANPQGLAVDSTGDIYIADSFNNRVRKISGGIITTVAGNGGKGFSGDGSAATDAQIGYPSAVLVDGSGALYISSGARIRKVSGGIITTIAGNGTYGWTGDNGPALDAQVSPAGMAMAPNGDLYFADGNHVVRKISKGIITTVAGSGTMGFSGDNGPATSAKLFGPRAVALDAAGNLYIADSTNERVRKVTDGIITTVAGALTARTLGDGGPATNASLLDPDSLAFDASGNLYVGDAGNHRLRKITNGIIQTAAGGGVCAGDSGPAEAAQFNVISSVAVDHAGNIYITDEQDNRVRMVSHGVVTTVAGTGVAGYSGDNGPASAAQLNGPLGVAVDSQGNLYIADYGNSRVRKVSGHIITTVAGNGTSGPGTGEGGPAVNAPEPGPMSVVLDGADNLYILDWALRVRRVSDGLINTLTGSLPDPICDCAFLPSSIAVDAVGRLYFAGPGSEQVSRFADGALTTVAGNGTYGFSGDGGPATEAQLFGPSGLAVDASGNLYISDLNQRIRRVSPQGIIETVAGNGTGGLDGDGRLAVNAELSAPVAVAVDDDGKIYVADQGNARIRVLSPVRRLPAPRRPGGRLPAPRRPRL